MTDATIRDEVANGGARPRSWPCVAALGAFTLAWFAPALFFGRTLLSFDERFVPPFVIAAAAPPPAASQNFVTSDLQGWILAHTSIATERLARGEISLWTPTELLGRPSHADGSFPIFYLPDAIHLLLPTVSAYACSSAFHFFWAGLGMFFGLRRARLRPLAALFGAFAFAFSGWMQTHLHIPHFTRSAAWLPWLLLASVRLAELPSARRAVALALVVGLAALAAFPPVLGVMVFGLALAAVFSVLRARRKVAAAGWHVAALALGFALASVQLLPMQELRAQSVRSANLSEEMARRKSLRPAHLVSLAAPDFQGNPVLLRDAGIETVEADPVAREFFASEVQDNYVENTLYGGVSVLLLAIVALGTAWRRPIGLATSGFTLLLVLALAIAAPTPFQHVFREWLVPGLGSGSPKRVLLLAAFALAGLAAIGFDRLLDARRAAPRWLAASGIALAALCLVGLWISDLELPWWGSGASSDLLACVRGLLHSAFGLPAALGLFVAACAPWFRVSPRASRLAALALFLLLVADLFLFGWRFNPFQSSAARGRATPVVEFLQRPENHGRTLRLPRRELLPAAIASQWGVESVDGISPLIVREVAELLDRWQPGSIDAANPYHVGDFRDARRLALPLVNLLARWIVVSQPLPPESNPGFELKYTGVPEGLGVYENPRALGAVFLADRACVIADREQRLAALVSSDFAPARVAIVESIRDVTGLPTDAIVANPVAPPAPAATAIVRSERVNPETLRVHVETPAVGVLVVNEAFAPGWRVEEGDRSQPVVRVDHAFFGVPLSAGAHDLLFRYVPRSFQIGAVVSIGSAVLLAALAVVGGIRRRGAAAAVPLASPAPLTKA